MFRGKLKRGGMSHVTPIEGAERSLIIRGETVVLTLVIGILITVVIGAILFWIIEKFCPEARLAQLLKLLVLLLCLGSIVSRLYPLFGSSSVP